MMNLFESLKGKIDMEKEVQRLLEEE